MSPDNIYEEQPAKVAKRVTKTFTLRPSTIAAVEEIAEHYRNKHSKPGEENRQEYSVSRIVDLALAKYMSIVKQSIEKKGKV